MADPVARTPARRSAGRSRARGSPSPRATTPAHDQREAAAPVVGDGGEVAVGPPRLAVGLGQVAQLGGGERLDRAQRADRPGLADPLAERQEDPGQPPGLGEPAGEQPGVGRGAAQPGPADRVAESRRTAGRRGPAPRRLPAKSPRVVVTQARFCSDQACPRSSPAATLTW